MSNTEWRLFGGVGHGELDLDLAQLMTQGIGFPLRPVDGVPYQDYGEYFEGVPIAPTLGLQWAGYYEEGFMYLRGYTVRDGGWLMVANTNTVSHAAPQPTGSPEWMHIEAPSWSTPSDESVVYSGYQLTFTEAGWLQGLRIWAPELTATTNYRVTLIDTTDPLNPITHTYEEPVLTENDWTILAGSDRLVTAGTVLTMYIDALNSAESANVGEFGYTYDGAVNSAPPTIGGWNHHSQQNLVRVSATDLDATDRTTQLLSLEVGSDLLFAETLERDRFYKYRVLAKPTSVADYVEFSVALTEVGGLGAPAVSTTTSFNGTVYTPQPTQYVELPGGAPTPSWATVTGILQYDGVDQGGSANGYGIDIRFDTAVISPDWDIMNFTG